MVLWENENFLTSNLLCFYTSVKLCSLAILVSKQNNSSTDLADTVGGATGRDSIASMWSSHFSQLFNCVTCDRHKNYTMEAVKLITNDYDTFTPGDINRSIASLCSNKACGIDVLFAEHLLHASPDIHVLLSICFNAFIVHGFLPNPFTCPYSQR